MINLLIPSLGIAGTIMTGSTLHWNSQNWEAHQREADRILSHDYIYRYPHAPTYGAHDYSTFKGLENIRHNALVIIGTTRYRVKNTSVVPNTETSILNNTGTLLFTCTNNNKDRFVVDISN